MEIIFNLQLSIFKHKDMRQKLGQHFLKNKEVLEKEVAALELKNGETVVEIGSGRGALTNELGILNYELRIVGIEKDPKLVEDLKSNFSENKSIEITEGDVLKVLPEITKKFKPNSYKLIGNIPYYLTGFLLRTIGELENKPKLCVFIIQKEVAERIAAKPPKMNKLAASVQFWANPEILRSVPRKDFSPPPDVESSLIKLTIHSFQFSIQEEKYYRAVNVLFQQPRKTILNNLRLSRDTVETQSKFNSLDKLSEGLKKIGIDPKSRPQDLGIQEIIKIAKGFNF